MAFLKKLEKKLLGERYEAIKLDRKLAQSQPLKTDISVCFYGEAPNFFAKGGKVSAFEYLPVFCDHLRRAAVQTVFASTLKDLEKFLANAERNNSRTIIVCIFREIDFTPKDPEILALIDKADLVFNNPRSGAILANKPSSHAALTENGCSLPILANSLPEEAAVFSNEIESSGAEAFITTNQKTLDDKRFNTQFIDTRMIYGGAQYHTTVRLMCINDKITHTFMRARNAEEGNASVHAIDTPQDSDLINTLWKETLGQYEAQFQSIANAVFQTYGCGFYSHDTLVDHSTQKAYICETGYKFNDMSYERRIADFRDDIIGMQGFVDPRTNAATSAPIFLDIVKQELARAAS